ncbi:hypothetical protein BWI97_01955 [Siphonobacter sp. BAB-5405]|uniref:PAS domain S-box protein n=1 Tax=Siphonobacter sp. BAB-5405 TaxID=1864825 RepID=UPI000C7FFE3B|nr:PAS domain S-box protein [Siphonobacter sp. BAB-5405]PMD99195.1 hypothetical protein BWI97_01955 [Siphonobacter sp. BAB-5405]
MNTSDLSHESGSPSPIAAIEYQALIESFAQAFWETDAEGKIIKDSPSWRAYTGQTLDEWLAGGWVSAVHPEDRPFVASQWKQAMELQKPMNAEFRLKSPDGTWRWTNLRAMAIHDQTGAIIKWVGINLDITNLKRTEQALRTSEAKQRIVLESAKDYAFITLDLNRRVTSWSSGAQAILGYEEEEITGQLCDVFFVPEDRAMGAPEREAEKAIREGRAENERWHIRKDGTRFYGSGMTTPLRNEQGVLFGLTKVMRDLTAQKQSEDALREAHERMIDILEGTSDAFYALDVHFQFTYVNKKAAQLWGRDRHALMGKHYWTEFPNAVASETYEKHYEVFEKRQLIQFETVSPIIGRWIDVSIYPGKDGGLSVFFRDITSRKEAEARQAFLLKLGDALRPLVDPGAIQATATRLLGEQLGTDRVYYAEIGANAFVIVRDWHRAGSTNWVRYDPWDDWPMPGLQEGQTWVMNDTASDPVLLDEQRSAYLDHGIGAAVVVPLLKQQRLAAAFVTSQRTARPWTPAEVSLVKDTAERTWAAVERAQTEVMLHRNQVHLQSIFQTAQVGISEISLDGRFLRVNDKLCQLLEREPNQLIGLSILDITFADDIPSSRQALRKLITTGEVVSLDKRYLKPDGTGLWANSSISLLRQNTSSQVPTILAITVDLTQRKEAEEALRKQELRTRLAIEAAELGTWEWDLERDLIHGNEQHFQLLGLTVSTVPEPVETFVKHIHPEDLGRIQSRLKQTVQERVPYDEQFRIIRQNGQVRWMSGYGKVTAEHDGQAIQVSGVMFDITDRKEAEQALRESEAQLMAMFESLPVGVGVIDVRGKLVLANQAMPYYLPTGIIPSRDRLQVNRWQAYEADGNLVSAENFPAARALQGERVVPGIEILYTPEEGNPVWTRVAAVAIRDENGSVKGVVTVVTDINESKLTQQALQEADRRKDEFLAMLAHELRNPMSTLSNGLQILSLTAATNPQASTVVQRMITQTDHLVRMVEDLLDVSRISRGKIVLRKEPVNLVEVVRQATESSRSLFVNKQQTLEVSLPPVSIQLNGDATRLVQVGINLLTNASRYTGPQGTIQLSLEQRETEAILQVRDNGIGLAADQLTVIFDLFVQVDNSLARSQGGLGLGLTLVKQIVDLHGGHVIAESEGLGQGSTFTVYLPTPERAASSEENRIDFSNSAHLPRLLLVDDNPDVTFTLGMLLELKGYTVDVRNEGRAGIQAAQELKPDVILLDIGMPDLDGYETCRQIRQQAWGKNMYIIAVSGYGQKEDLQKGKEAGFNQHLTKPVELNVLIQMLNSR